MLSGFSSPEIGKIFKDHLLPYNVLIFQKKYWEGHFQTSLLSARWTNLLV